MLQDWEARATSCLVISDEADDAAVGFCTLSRLEAAGLPVHYIEICHLVVNPRFRYVFVGARLIRAALQAARINCCRYICGRVVPTNRYALALTRYVRGEEITGSESWTIPGFAWFRLKATEGDSSASEAADIQIVER